MTREIGVSPAFLVPVAQDAIPKTEIGKIQRTKLRKGFEAGAFDEQVRATQLLLGTAATVPDWFLRPVWQRARTHAPQEATPGRHTLVLTGDDARSLRIAERIADLLRATGERCTVASDGTSYARLDAARYRVRPGEQGDLAALWDELERDQRPVDAVVHLAGLRDGDAPSTDSYDESGTLSLLALARALVSRTGRQRPVDLVYATAGAQQVRAEDRPAPGHAMAGALLKSLAEELGWLRGAHVDLPPDAGEDAAELLLAEARVAPDAAEVAYRDGHRQVRRLAPLPEAPPRPRPAPAEGFTLVTGGLGGVGGEVAAHLLGTPGTRLLVLGRTPEDALDGSDAPADGVRRGEVLRRLRELGEVRYACADVTDEARVRAAVDAAAEAWGMPLTAVLHLAGTLVERPVGELDEDTWRRAVAAKAGGAWTLHRLTADHPVSSFVTFSSVNGFFGGAMNAAYAAANAALDALALYRRSLGLPAQSLAWSMWREQGVSRGYRLAALTEARGYRLLDGPAALRSFDLARSLDVPHLLIGADRTAPWVRSHVTAPVRPVRRPAARVGLADGADLGALYRAAGDAARAAGLADDWVLRSAGTTGDHPEQAGTGEDARRLEGRLAEVWCAVLGRDRVGLDENFFDLGGNSLLLVTAQSAVNTAFDADVSVVDLFAHPTVRALARHLATTARPAAAQPSPGPEGPGAGADGPAGHRSAGSAPSGLDRAKEQAQRQRAARARRTARHGKDRGHA